MFKTLYSVVKYFALAVIIWYMAASERLDWQVIRHFFTIKNIHSLLLFAMFFLAMNTISALRQSLFTASIGQSLSFLSSLKIILIGVFCNSFLPGGFGGDVVRGALMHPKLNVSYSSLTGILVMDRFLGLYSLLLAGLVGAGVIFLEGTFSFKWIYILWYLIYILPLFPLILFLRASRFHVWLKRRLHGRRGAEQIDNFLSAILMSSVGKRQIFKGLALALAGSLLNCLAIACLAGVMNGIEEVYPVFLLCPVILIVGMLPVTPGNIGWTEMVGQTVLDLAGISDGATVFIVWRVLFCLFSLSGGILYLVNQRPAHAAQK